MSLIYAKLTSIVNKISQLFHESLLFTIIFSILNYFEKAWVNSYFKGLYPGENFLGFIKKNKILIELCRVRKKIFVKIPLVGALQKKNKIIKKRNY